MLNNLKELWTQWCEVGLKWPYAYDPTSKTPSITLLMLYFATIVMFTAEITNLFIQTMNIPVLVTVFVWFLAFIMYRLRKLDKVKLDLDDQSLEIESSDGSEQKDNTKNE